MTKQTSREKEVAKKVKARFNCSKRPHCVLMPRKRCKASYCKEARRHYSERGVFVNIPYVQDYEKLEIALWLTLKLHGLLPLLARDHPLEGLPRICRIAHLQLRCKFGFSDFTFNRLNIAIEDAMMRKEGISVILAFTSRKDTEAFKSLGRVASDYLPIDPVTHEGDPHQLIVNLSTRIQYNWKPLYSPESHLTWAVYKALMKLYSLYDYSRISEFYQQVELLLARLLTNALRWDAARP